MHRSSVVYEGKLAHGFCDFALCGGLCSLSNLGLEFDHASSDVTCEDHYLLVNLKLVFSCKH